MIRFIDLTDQINDETKEFSFYNTVNDQFESYNGCVTWETKQDFINDYDGNELQRYLNLIPDDWDNPVRQNLSKDYEKLYRLITENEGLKVPCFVNYTGGGTKIYRDIAAARFFNNQIDVGVRGVGYSCLGTNTLPAFIEDCKRMNLEFFE